MNRRPACYRRCQVRPACVCCHGERSSPRPSSAREGRGRWEAWRPVRHECSGFKTAPILGAPRPSRMGAPTPLVGPPLIGSSDRLPMPGGDTGLSLAQRTVTTHSSHKPLCRAGGNKPNPNKK
eukprot:scaffold7422_cov134-Isochrysis_galbana.AAC.12